MASSSQSPEPITLHLLDSAQGHPVQTWQFRDKRAITLGRSADCDVVLADVHVSRAHASLLWQEGQPGGQWTILSTGRHGTLINDRLIAESRLERVTTFRLGPNGPVLRFECGISTKRPSETIDAFQPELLNMLEIDRDRLNQEVEDIAGNALFQELQERVRQSRMRASDATGATGETKIR
jgi:pSer/pThr/pTyr-binding forkhead associated (FHA) protein